MPWLALLACSGPSRLATIPGAARIGELATGELVVATEDGQIFLVSAFGDTRRIGAISSGAVEDLVTEPSGRFWLRTMDGSVYSGSPWSEPELSGTAALIVRDCGATSLVSQEEAGDATVFDIGGDCVRRLVGTRAGGVSGEQVSGSAITRVQSRGSGFLWVDAEHRLGCSACTLPDVEGRVVDAITMHLAPFVPGEVVWVDEGGVLWSAPG